MVRLVVLLALVHVTGCSWMGLGQSAEQQRLEDGSSTPVVIPEGIDTPDFVDLMPIPEVADYRGISGQEVEVRLPDALSTSFGVEQIVIRRLGDDRWVFLDLPTSAIWPQVVLFWEENHLPLANLDPRSGTLETEWLIGAAGDAEMVYESITSGSAWANKEDAVQYKFRIRVEPGVRNGSSELYVEQKQIKLGGPFRIDNVEWDGTSDSPELEGKVLSVLAYFLSERVAQGPSVSLLAAGLQESKATLVAESNGMVLLYKLDFDRAWATVGAALEDARVEVADLNRTDADYFVRYTSQHNPNPGFFSKLFSRGKSTDSATGDRFKVHLETMGDDIRVTVLAEIADDDNAIRQLLLSERLLKLIKEYST